MPKSKRSRIVHTSAVQKKPAKERSAVLYAAVREAASTYAHVFVFSVANMRNTFLKDVRSEFADDGRLFFGKTKVMSKALGSSPADEVLPGQSGLAKYLKGSVGLLLTDRAPTEVLEYFEGFSELDYARAGAKATQTFIVPAGVVYQTAGVQAVEDDVPLPHSLEATVRKWGMPTRLDKGRVTLDQEWQLCRQGKVLNSNQTALLKLFGCAMAEFRIRPLAYWSAASSNVEVVDQEAADEAAAGDVVDEDMMDDGIEEIGGI